jgi:hypothetical protein
MIRSAYLRVYLPATPASRSIEHPGNLSPRFIRATDHLVWNEPIGDDAFTITWADETYVCPREPRLRMLEAALAFARANPASGLMPLAASEHIASELARLRIEHPRARSHILTSPWHVPLRWFAVFDPDEREIYDYNGHASIRYRTPVAAAHSRSERAIEILDNAGFDDSVIDDVRDLHDWIKGFSSEGVLELDYAATAALFDAKDLVLDESAAEVHASLKALDTHDFDQAGRAYASVAGRWAQAQSLAYVN